jgi:hypothetical protein
LVISLSCTPASRDQLRRVIGEIAFLSILRAGGASQTEGR